ncbi:MAG: hypothetical protein RLZZ419_1256, partial [Pseudomonadota bacterium]
VVVFKFCGLAAATVAGGVKNDY